MPQCGYCQSGMLMAAAALLKQIPNPTDADIDQYDHQHLPLRHLYPRPRCHPQGGRDGDGLGGRIMNEITKPSRRQFLVMGGAASGALVISGAFSPAVAGAPDVEPWQKPDAPGSVDFTPWLTISPDDTVTVRVAAVDIGNGPLTQALSYVNEELSPDWAKMKPEYADPNADYKQGGVFSKPGGLLAYFSGRSTAPARVETYMQVAASARERLKAAAAQQWGVPATEITVLDGFLNHPSGKKAGFGEMVALAGHGKARAEEPKPKDPSQWVFLTKKSPPKSRSRRSSTVRRSTAWMFGCRTWSMRR